MRWGFVICLMALPWAPALPAQETGAQVTGACPAGLREIGRQDRGGDIVVTCGCDTGFDLLDNQCVAVAGPRVRDIAALTAGQFDLLAGRTITGLDALRADGGSARGAIALWQAGRGYHGRARRLLPDDPGLADLDLELASLESRVGELIGGHIQAMLLIGDFGAFGDGAAPYALARLLLDAHLAAKAGDFERAAAVIGEAVALAPGDPRMGQAAAYLTRLRAAEGDSGGLPDTPAIARRENLARGYAAWTLAVHLRDHGHGERAMRQYTEAAAILNQAGRDLEARSIFELVETMRSGDDRGLEPGAAGIYADASSSDILLDALDYGAGDRRRAIRYLETARAAAAYDPAIDDALRHMRALARD